MNLIGDEPFDTEKNLTFRTLRTVRWTTWEISNRLRLDIQRW